MQEWLAVKKNYHQLNIVKLLSIRTRLHFYRQHKVDKRKREIGTPLYLKKYRGEVQNGLQISLQVISLRGVLVIIRIG